ncbi:hypothetical protein [Chitinophaga sancti]|uniref:Uncharacterized protein n=1 Tax=Chitinophaga sancti TaxID=1004 RepID=A0A1K1S181_9BACT|nr:hypothetical protein [Chitinophaga sancti]WQD59758.1 hypothetical protein U0033_17865 [Chitinophaga sancti]WQG88111.1 hypothetical protein SR876_24600 [Chitinophaga sancti]SFW77914.1 hypothetical protein SAMN05661012_04541 [Chitinophaga sancti]
MPLKRISEQNSYTIEEDFIYLTKSDSDFQQGVGKAMLAVIHLLNQHFPDETIWCMTSHDRVILLKQDDWQTPKYVIFSALDIKQYSIEYRMPAEISPWQGAYVRGSANSPDQALEYILIALNNSDYWAS